MTPRKLRMKSPAKSRILFVCEWNSCRSQMAEAFASFHGAAGVEVYSAGTKPCAKVDPLTIKFMQEIGYDLSRQVSKSVSQVPKVKYDIVVDMAGASRLPTVDTERREFWDIPNPKDLSAEGFRRVRDLIEQKVLNLLGALEPAAIIEDAPDLTHLPPRRRGR